MNEDWSAGILSPMKSKGTKIFLWCLLPLGLLFLLMLLAGFGLLLVPLLLMQFYFYYQLFWQNGDSVLLLPGFLGLDRRRMKDEEE